MANSLHSVLGRCRNALSSRSVDLSVSRKPSTSFDDDKVAGLSKTAPLLAEE